MPRPPLPREVWVLGFVSLFMDLSSEMAQSLMPVFLTTGLGASALAVGLIDGAGEAVAALTKVFSGRLSDRLGNRKGLAVFGYGLAALTKPLFPIAQGVALVAAARLVDRVGKGIRGAPRDALVADLTPAGQRGAAFGLRQSLDTIGAFVGPLAALALMIAFHADMRLVFWVAVAPAVVSVSLLAFAVREPKRGPAKKTLPLRWSDARRLGRPFWMVIGLALLLGACRFGEPFLILRAQSLGLPLTWSPIVLVAMNVAYALSAYPAGLLSDKMNRRTLFGAGLALLAASDGLLAYASDLILVFAGVVVWGAHMGLTQGLLAALTADATPEALRGTGFGIMNLVHGAALLAGGAAAGLLWQAVGPGTTYAMAMLAALLAVVLVLFRPRAAAI